MSNVTHQHHSVKRTYRARQKRTLSYGDLMVLAALVQLTPVTATASETDYCTEIKQAVLKVVANGRVGLLGDSKQGIPAAEDAGGRYHFQTIGQWEGEAISQIQGTCRNNEISFRRLGPDNLKQSYTGWIFDQRTGTTTGGTGSTPAMPATPAGHREMAGSFQQTGSPKSYGWHAKIIPVAVIEMCDISGRIEGDPGLVSQIMVTVHSKLNPAERIAPPLRPGTGGEYSFQRLPAGEYRIRPDIRADTMTRWDPAYRDITCKGKVTNVNFTVR